MAQKKLSKKLYKINLLIKKGFKEKTENLFKKIFCISKKRKKINPIVKMNEAMTIIKPFYEIRTKKSRGNLIQIP